MRYCINIKQSKAKRELYLLINNSFKTFLILLLTFILSFSISCSNEDKTGSEENNSGSGSGSGSAVNNHLSGSSTGAGTAADLEGRWIYHHNIGITNGQLTAQTTPPYSGQIPSSFNYPFTIVLTSPYGGETGTAVFTFYNASNGAYYYYIASTGSGGKINWSTYKAHMDKSK